MQYNSKTHPIENETDFEADKLLALSVSEMSEKLQILINASTLKNKTRQPHLLYVHHIICELSPLVRKSYLEDSQKTKLNELITNFLINLRNLANLPDNKLLEITYNNQAVEMYGLRRGMFKNELSRFGNCINEELFSLLHLEIDQDDKILAKKISVLTNLHHSLQLLEFYKERHHKYLLQCNRLEQTIERQENQITTLQNENKEQHQIILEQQTQIERLTLNNPLLTHLIRQGLFSPNSIYRNTNTLFHDTETLNNKPNQSPGT